MSAPDDADESHIATSSLERLIHMANQIARFFASQTRQDAVAGTADHLAKFWDPRMRETIRRHLRDGGAGLEPIARDAVASLDR